MSQSLKTGALASYSTSPKTRLAETNHERRRRPASRTGDPGTTLFLPGTEPISNLVPVRQQLSHRIRRSQVDQDSRSNREERGLEPGEHAEPVSDSPD